MQTICHACRWCGRWRQETMSVSRSAVAKWESDKGMPGIIQGADYLNELSAYYLVETGGKQLLVKVSSDFITTCELANKVNPKKFEYGKYVFRKAAYQLIEQ